MLFLRSVTVQNPTKLALIEFQRVCLGVQSALNQILDLEFKVHQKSVNPNLEIEHSLDLEHFKPSTDQSALHPGTTVT